MEKTFKISTRIKLLLNIFHFSIFSSFIIIPLLVKIFFDLSWIYTFLFFLIYLYAGAIWMIVPLVIFLRAMKSFKDVTFINIDENGISSKTKSIPWNSINGLIFKSLNGAGFISTKSIERFLGYFVLRTSSGDYPIPSTIENLDDLLKIIVEKANLKKISPTIQGSILHSLTIFQRRQGDFYSWERQNDYSPTSDDFIFKASYAKDFLSLFFVLLIGVILVFSIAYFSAKFNLL